MNSDSPDDDRYFAFGRQRVSVQFESDETETVVESPSTKADVANAPAALFAEIVCKRSSLAPTKCPGEDVVGEATACEAWNKAIETLQQRTHQTPQDRRQLQGALTVARRLGWLERDR